MTDLEDLVRATLAERAHDVDRVQLNAVAVRPARTRRWVAVGSVAAAAAAIVAAVVLIAPWAGPPFRSADLIGAEPPPPTQQVSFHGITLTVPASWGVGRFGCFGSGAPGDGNTVTIIPTNLPNCPTHPSTPGPITTSAPVTRTSVTLQALTSSDGPGTATTVAGHPARWVDTYGPEGTPPLLQLPDVGVQMSISAPAGGTATVLAGLSYTPLDARGCDAQLPASSPDVDDTVLAAAVSGAVCEYDVSGPDGTFLLGSRTLTAAEITALQRAVTGSRAAPSGVDGTVLYRATTADGRSTEVRFDANSAPADLPRAYP
ncbi:hypothetical protein ACXR2U_22720 [Jatrophihabitans sp. YIM 134969]